VRQQRRSGTGQGGHLFEQDAPIPTPQQLALGRTARIAQMQAHQKAVQLRLGQRVRAELVVRVLGGDDKKSLGIKTEVNCTRENRNPKLCAKAWASVVLPAPGKPSISRCPPVSKQVTASQMTPDLPTMTVSSWRSNGAMMVWGSIMALR